MLQTVDWVQALQLSIGSGKAERTKFCAPASPFEAQIASRVKSAGQLAILCVPVAHFVF